MDKKEDEKEKVVSTEIAHCGIYVDENGKFYTKCVRAQINDRFRRQMMPMYPNGNGHMMETTMETEQLGEEPKTYCDKDGGCLICDLLMCKGKDAKA